jgi:2-desacetyl-2-hydroxyethyl bacteriochlorophyllide A dehydrogenase
MNRAALYVERGTVTSGLAASKQEPGPGEVAIDVAYTGICGTDMHIFHGHMDGRVSRPLTPGHEMSGTVAQLGVGVTDLGIGDKVVVMPLDWCGECYACEHGYTNVCHRLRFLGIDAPGSMQQSWVVPARVVLPVPDHVELSHAALVEPVAVAVHDVRRAGVAVGDRVVVIGGGPIGQLIAWVARRRGSEVALSEPDPARREFAGADGFTVVDPTATDVAEWVADWSPHGGADIAFEVSATKAGARAMTDVLVARGRAVIVGIHSEPPPVDLHRCFWRELTLIGARVYERADFAEAVDLVASGDIPLDRFISAVYPLTSAGEAFTRLDAGEGVMKVLVDIAGEVSSGARTGA